MLRMLDKMFSSDSAEHWAWVVNVREVVREETDVPELVRNLKAEIEANFRRQIEYETDPRIRATVKAYIESIKEDAIKLAIAPIEAKIELKIEAAIDRYSAELEKLKTMTERMLETGNNFDKADEILETAMKSGSGDVISGNIDNYSQGFLRKYQDIKTDFINALRRKNVAEFTLTAERKILKVGARLKSMHQEFEFEENYYPDYNRAKSYLRETRQNLRDLAISTRIEARDLKILLENLPESNDSLLFKIYTNRMKDLWIDPAVLTVAVDNYNSAVKTFENANSYIAQQIIGLEKILSLDEMSESGRHFNKGIKVLTDILNEEIDQIRTWNKCVKVLHTNFDSYSEETLREDEITKIIFIKGLADLKDAADTFFAQPRDIIKLA